MSYMRYYDNLKRKLIKRAYIEPEEISDEMPEEGEDLVTALMDRNAFLEKQNADYLKKIRDMRSEIDLLNKTIVRLKYNR